MTDKNINIFKETGALLDGHFVLTSGRHSATYFQCAKVLQHPHHLSHFAEIIMNFFKKTEIDAVISPALGGIVIGTEVGRQLGVKTIFAERQNGIMTLRRGFEINEGEKILVVEDVITTGGSVKEVMNLFLIHISDRTRPLYILYVVFCMKNILLLLHISPLTPLSSSTSFVFLL
mgnify:CR=1 FL=1